MEPETEQEGVSNTEQQEAPAVEPSEAEQVKTQLAAAQAALAAEREGKRKAEEQAQEAVRQLAMTAVRMQTPQAAPQAPVDEFAALKEHLPAEVVEQLGKLVASKVEPLQAKLYEAEIRARTAEFEADLATKHKVTVPKEYLQKAQEVSAEMRKRSGGAWNHEDTLDLAIGRALRDGKLTFEQAQQAMAQNKASGSAPSQPAQSATLTHTAVPASSKPSLPSRQKSIREEIEELEKKGVADVPLF